MFYCLHTFGLSKFLLLIQVTSTKNITQAKIKQHCLDYERTLVAEMFFIDQEITSYNM